MSARALPELPGCGRAASARIEAYSPRDRLAHGSLDASVYACGDHAQAAVDALAAAGFSPYQMPVSGPLVCGQGMDFTGVRIRVLEPSSARTVPAWCRRCRSKTTTVTGVPEASPGGVLRVRGRCSGCGLGLRTIVGKEAAR